jgi:integrase/recombinase XerD
MNLSLDHINEYVVYFRRQGNKQPSVERYQHVLKSWLEFCEGKNFKDCSRADVINFKIQLMSRVKPVTANFYLAVIREFFGYLERMDNGIDITKGVENLKVERVIPSFVEIEELGRLLELTDNDPSLFVFQSPGSAMINARDIAIFETVIGTGIKAKQLCEIKRSDIDMTTGYLNVRSGAKRAYRTIPVPHKTLNAIRKFSEYREKIFQQSPYFFIYRTGAKFHPRCVNRVCNKFLNQTASKNKGPQTLRNNRSYKTLKSCKRV